MATDPPENLTEAASPVLDAAGDSNSASVAIGPYQLLHLIGQGGMGEVWLAEQKQPGHRRIALKLIKAGMDTREVVAWTPRGSSDRRILV